MGGTVFSKVESGVGVTIRRVEFNRSLEATQIAGLCRRFMYYLHSMKKTSPPYLMLVLAVLLAPLHALAQYGADAKADETIIRSQRTQSNKAIQARDLTGFGKTMRPDMVVTRGSGSHVSGRDAVLASVSVQFADKSFLGYERITDNIQISTSAPLAAERGHWIGRFQRPDGIQTVTGVYLAMWQKDGEGWRIRSELFVSLACTGSAACGK